MYTSSSSQSQEFGQGANLASDWLHESYQPIRCQVSKLTQLLIVFQTQKFPPQDSQVFDYSVKVQMFQQMMAKKLEGIVWNLQLKSKSLNVHKTSIWQKTKQNNQDKSLFWKYKFWSPLHN